MTKVAPRNNRAANNTHIFFMMIPFDDDIVSLKNEFPEDLPATRLPLITPPLFSGFVSNASMA
jgi:hypothetical protein